MYFIMDQHEETQRTWNKLASLYEEKFMHLNIYNESYDYICDIISKHGAELLEIGCGPGNITKYILSKRDDFNIYGIDNAPNMIELARKNNPKAKFDVMDCRLINSLTSKFDGIICGFGIPYLSKEDCEKLIIDTYQLLNEQGLLYISFVAGDSNKSGYVTGSSGDRIYFYYHPENWIKQALLAQGFGAPKVFEVAYQRSENDPQEIHTIICVLKIG